MWTKIVRDSRKPCWRQSVDLFGKDSQREGLLQTGLMALLEKLCLSALILHLTLHLLLLLMCPLCLLCPERKLQTAGTGWATSFSAVLLLARDTQLPGTLAPGRSSRAAEWVTDWGWKERLLLWLKWNHHWISGLTTFSFPFSPSNLI